MILTATSRIEGIVILQHHLVTGVAIIGANVLEQRHRAPRRSARRAAPSRTTSSAHSRPRLPALNRTPLGSEAARNRIPASRSAPSGAPSTPASAPTAARIHRNPGRRDGRTHRATASGRQAVRYSVDRSEQHADQDRVHTEQGHLFSTHPVRRRFKTLRQDHPQRPARTQTPSFRNAPSTATSSAASTRRVRCPRTPAHRAVLAPSTTYSPNAPSPPRPASGTPAGTPPRRPSPDRRRVWRAREPASTRRAQRPWEPASTHRVKRPGDASPRSEHAT